MTNSIRIELAAVRTLNEWEAVFSEAVRKEAHRIAVANGRPELIMICDYRQAAPIAVRLLTSAISEPSQADNHGEQKAA